MRIRITEEDNVSTVQLPTRVPATPDEINTLAELAHATGWALAATVWAWTKVGKPAPGTAHKSVHGSDGPYELQDFAAKGFRGLSSRNTVAAYRRAWQWAIDAGQAAPLAPAAPAVAWRVHEPQGNPE